MVGSIAYTGGEDHAQLWTGPNGDPVELHPTSGFDVTYATAIHGGQQVGSGYEFGPSHALLWNGSAASMVDLHPTLLDGFYWTVANGTNAVQQVGTGYLLSDTTHALSWTGTADSAVDLHPVFLGDSGSSYAFGTDGVHQVGKGSGSSAGLDFHAILWSGTAGSAIDLHPTNWGSPGWSEAVAVRGNQQVGSYSVASLPDVHAVLWNSTADSAVDLHPTQLSEFSRSVAKDTNGTQQVGTATHFLYPNEYYYHAMLWHGTAESAVDLHDLLPAGFTRSEAYSINQQGTIYGIAYDAADLPHAVMWAPVPEPSTVALAAFGLLGAVIARRRRQFRFGAASTKYFMAVCSAALLWSAPGTARADWLIKSYSLTNSITNYAAADALIAGDGLLPGFPVSSQYTLAHLQDNDVQITSDLGLGQQFVGLPGFPTDSDNFVFVGQGTLNVAVSGNYRFRTGTDDGSRLRISVNGGPMQQIITDDVLSAMHIADSLPVSLAAGDKVDFDWMTFERGGGAESALLYSNGIAPKLELVGNPSLGLALEGGSFTGNVYLAPTTPISNFAEAEAMKATPRSLRGSVLRNLFNLADGGPDIADGVFELFDGGVPSPGMNTFAEHYLSQGTGWLVVRPEQAGEYLFHSFSDDGSRLRIDLNVDGDFDDEGELVINDDSLVGPHGANSNFVALAAGHYPVEYSFFNAIFAGEGEISAVLMGGGPTDFFLVGDEAAGGLDVIQVPEPTSMTLTAITLITVLTLRKQWPL